MKKKLISVLIACLIIYMPTTIMAATEQLDEASAVIEIAIDVTNEAQDATVGLYWVVSRTAYSSKAYPNGTEVANSIPYSLFIGYDSDGMKPVYASGTLYLTGIISEWPWAGLRTGMYEGTIYAYLNGDLINP